MDDKKKKRSPKPCLAQPAQAPGTLRRVPVPTSHSGSLALGLPHLPSPKQRTKFKRVGKEKCRPVLAGGGSGSAGTPLQHSFLTEVTDVYEMEGGLLNLLNDFHSGRLQAFGKECSFEQLEHVREMQEKLARLHFSLDGVTEGLPEEQKKTMADRNLDQLLSNVGHKMDCLGSWGHQGYRGHRFPTLPVKSLGVHEPKICELLQTHR
ncbi:Coiled-coil domain-containing protein 28B [Lemmus lemmus]